MKSIGEKIADGIQKFYTAFINQRVLTTPEEVQANTNEKNLASAVVVGEIYNNLMSMGGFLPIIDPATGKITGYKTDVGGADTVFPFSGSYTVIFRLTLSVHGWTDGKNYGSRSWNVTAKISDGKCTFSPSSVPMINSILSSELNGQRRVYVPWSIALISITAD